jgi:hypothetical protein
MEVSTHESASAVTFEGVQCLECGVAYSKPADGGTVAKNPGCPMCGYVGWVPLNPAGSGGNVALLRPPPLARPSRRAG